MTSNSLLRLSFLLYCFNVKHFLSQLMNCCCNQKSFQVSLNNQFHNKFQFTNSNQNKYNSIHLPHSNIHHISFIMHQIQNLSTKINSNSPKLSIMPYQRLNLYEFKKSILPFFVSFAYWNFDCRCSLFCTFLLSCKTKKKYLPTLQSIMNKITQSY